MKRSLVIIGTACSMALIPAYSQAVTPSPSPLATMTTPTTSSPTPLSKNAQKDAVRQAFRLAVEQAQNGRDLAFADANATRMQSLSTAGKDRVARRAAQSAYKASVIGIFTAYKAAIMQAHQAEKAALNAINGK